MEKLNHNIGNESRIGNGEKILQNRAKISKGVGVMDNTAVTFSDEAKRHYEKACETNKGQQQFYYCSTSETITRRCLDLKCNYVFCEKCKLEPKKNVIKEYRLQAYLIKKALMADLIGDNWVLPISDAKKKGWRLLDAERNFAVEDLEKKDGSGRRLDILAYEADTDSFIVLELKAERAISKAKRELERYTATLRKNLVQANAFYSVTAKSIRGYIVCPAAEWPAVETRNTEDVSPWGLIEYKKEYLDDIENIEFAIPKKR